MSESPDPPSDPVKRQAEALEDGLGHPGTPRFLLHDAEAGETVALGVRFSNEQVALLTEDEDADVAVWPDIETLLMHKPYTKDDIIWWDEPPRDV